MPEQIQQEVKYDRDTNRMDCLGLDLNRPVDSVKPGKFPYLKNCRSYVAGRIEPRYGIELIGEVVAGETPLHSIRRLNDPANEDWTRVIGVGDHLAIGQAAFTDLDSGYSGNPLAMVPYRPLASPDSYMYIGDSDRMRKVNVAGSLDTIGYAPPGAAPAVALSNSPLYKVIDEFDSTAGWGQAGTAGAPSLLSAGPGYRTTGTISQILYDSGTTGWASVSLSSMVGVVYGERLMFNPGGGTEEIATVQAVFPVSTSTTISRIIYDSGSTGMASLVLATPIEQVAVDALIRNTTVGPENARIVGVVRGPDGNTSIRISTTNTWAATNAVQVLASFRVYLTANHAAAETVRTDGVRSSITVGTGTLTRTVALDLSMFSTGNPTHPEDYMCISFRVDRPDLVSELKVLLDVDPVTNDFTRNFYSRTFRASDLTPSVRNQQPLVSTRATVVQRDIIDQPIEDTSGHASVALPEGGFPALLTTPASAPNTISQQLESGDSQWVPLRFRLSDLDSPDAMVRVGTDDTRTLANVAAIRIVAIVTGTVVLDMDSWWIGGGYGPDTGDALTTPYLYRYRVRNPFTNVPSNFSPATRLELNPYRQSIVVAPTQYSAPSGTNITATDLVLDIVRFGGHIAEWHYIGTIPNSASPSFTDTISDDVAAGNPILGDDNFQPWPIKGVPVTGTTGSVAGTSVDDSGTSFSLSWAQGTRILINALPFTIYRVISTSRLELVENAGSQTAVTWRIDEPTILAQPLLGLWEWDNVFFACGDPINPGRLYYSNPDSETTHPDRYIDITSPSEPVMNGVQYNIRAFLWTSENFFQILKTGNPEAPYRHELIPNGKGLFSRWAYTREPAPFLCFLAKDGIYATSGGSPSSLTDDDLYVLFPNEGNAGQATNGVSAPDVVSGEARFLRLAYYDEYLYFDYAQIGGGFATLVMAFDLSSGSRGNASGGWFWDNYSPNVTMHYGEEGESVHSLLIGTESANLYQYAGESDNSTAISMELTTPSRDQGDSRLHKLYGDIMLDADTENVDAVCTPFFNNNASSVAAVTVNTSARVQTPIPLGSAWQTFRNISLNIVCLVTDENRPKFFIWEPRWTFESAPISAFSWEISPSILGTNNYKSVGLNKVTHVSTSDLELTYTIDGVAQTPIVIPASGGIYVQSVFRVPVMKARIYKLRIDSDEEFRLDTRDTFFEIKDWGSDGAYVKMRLFGDFSFVQG